MAHKRKKKILLFDGDKKMNYSIQREEFVEKVREYVKDKSTVRAKHLAEHFGCTSQQIAQILGRDLHWEKFNHRRWCPP